MHNVFLFASGWLALGLLYYRAWRQQEKKVKEQIDFCQMYYLTQFKRLGQGREEAERENKRLAAIVDKLHENMFWWGEEVQGNPPTWMNAVTQEYIIEQIRLNTSIEQI
jgi:hypothetical protein